MYNTRAIYATSDTFARIRNRGSYRIVELFTEQLIIQEAIMSEMLSPRQRPLGISIIQIITALQGVGDIIVSLIAFFVGTAITGLIGNIAAAASAVFLILGVLVLVFAWGLWTLKSWAFWYTVVIEALGVIGSLI